MAMPSTAPMEVWDAPSTVFMYTGSSDATMNTDAPKQNVITLIPHRFNVCSSEAPTTARIQPGSLFHRATRPFIFFFAFFFRLTVELRCPPLFPPTVQLLDPFPCRVECLLYIDTSNNWGLRFRVLGFRV